MMNSTIFDAIMNNGVLDIAVSFIKWTGVFIIFCGIIHAVIIGLRYKFRLRQSVSIVIFGIVTWIASFVVNYLIHYKPGEGCGIILKITPWLLLSAVLLFFGGNRNNDEDEDFE